LTHKICYKHSTQALSTIRLNQLKLVKSATLPLKHRKNSTGEAFVATSKKEDF
jgi:hypothetical protein